VQADWRFRRAWRRAAGFHPTNVANQPALTAPQQTQAGVLAVFFLASNIRRSLGKFHRSLFIAKSQLTQIAPT
jgi:hypothetical protein